MNGVRYYRDLLADTARIDAFRRAIEAVVEPGDRVLEIGTGLGTYSFFAARAGGRVWAVDGDPAIHLAEAIAVANGLGDRIEFIRGWVPDVALPEPVDVVIFEDFPTSLLDPTSLRLLREIHRRYAAPGARYVPRRARVMLAPVSSDEALRNALTFTTAEAELVAGIDWGLSRSYAANSPCRVQLEADALCEPATPIGEIRLDREPDARDLDGEATWRVSADGAVSSLAWWFELEVSEGDWVSNAPGRTQTVWGQTLFPLDPPLEVTAGNVLRGTVERQHDEDGAPGWFSWRAESGDTVARGHQFASLPGSLDDLALAHPATIPVLELHAQIETQVLRLVDGKRSLAEIVREIQRAHPEMSEPQARRTVTETITGRVRAELPGFLATRQANED